MGAAMHPPRLRRLSLRLALIASLLALLSAYPAQLLSSAIAAAPGGTTTEPAPAKAQNGLDASGAAAPSNPGGAGAPATTAASTPTTTYVPSGTVPPTATVTSTATSGVPSTPAPAATAVITRTPATSAANGGDRPLSTGTVAIAVLAALLILACAGWALARQRAFEPHWLVSLRHASAEAAFRTSASWSEFTDWIRIGR